MYWICSNSFDIEALTLFAGYINEAGVLNLKRFEIFLKNFAKNDRKNFIEQMDDEAYLSSKRTSNAWRNSVFTSHNDQENYVSFLLLFVKFGYILVFHCLIFLL